MIAKKLKHYSELILILIVVILLTIVAVGRYQAKRYDKHINLTIEQINTILRSAEIYEHKRHGYHKISISRLQQMGALSDEFDSLDLWGGKINLSGSNVHTLHIHMLGVPKDVCLDISKLLFDSQYSDKIDCGDVGLTAYYPPRHI